MNAKTVKTKSKQESQPVELPSILSFERKLETSDGLMFAGNWENVGLKTLKISKVKEDGSQYEIDVPAWEAIPITPRKNLSTQSAYGIKDADKSKPNPVAAGGDDATLPTNKDSLCVKFTLRIIGNLGKPFACNNRDFQRMISEKISAFKMDGIGLDALAHRYACNIANARFLWRNRVGADEITVRIFLGKEEIPLQFNATDYSLNDFELNSDSAELVRLKDFIFNGLNGDENSFTFMTVEAYVKLGNNQHVFPSQEMNAGEKRKVLFQLDGCAAIHNVKIGNAIRTIDNWYEDGAEFPIAVEPYGSVTQIGYAFRKSTNDLYTLLEKWLEEKESTENIDQATQKSDHLKKKTNLTPVTDDEKKYIVANLVRGGLFQGKAKDKKETKALSTETEQDTEDGE